MSRQDTPIASRARARAATAPWLARAKSPRAYRIGIDVGGTFTKAVLIDNATRAVVGRALGADHARSCAAALPTGVVEVFRKVLATLRRRARGCRVPRPQHDAGDQRAARRRRGARRHRRHGRRDGGRALAETQVRVAPIELAPGRMLATANRFLVTDGMSEAAGAGGHRRARAPRARSVLVASSAFGVDNTGSEELVRTLGGEAGLLTTCGHEITRLYGLTTRTRTAVINASILPRMIATATMTEASVREAGIAAPLMIMRGDGGVMDIHEMRRRPGHDDAVGAGGERRRRADASARLRRASTSRSAAPRPTSASSATAARPSPTRASAATRPMSARSTCASSASPAAAWCARARGELVDVGPRSAHIAGLPYAAFADASDIVDPRIELFEPKPGDGADYVAVRVASGARYALTTTCAANVLGYAKPGMHAHGNPRAARRAFAAARGASLGVGVERRRARVLDRASDKLVPGRARA